MSKIQIYRLQPKEGQRPQLLSALHALAQGLASVAGSLGSELLDAWDGAGPVIFIERWANDEAHAASSKALPPTVFKTIMQSVEGKPEIMGCKPADGSR
ncbi:MAG: antibiotic biosynthesis monooxygenase family protein [Sphingobium sp.]